MNPEDFARELHTQLTYLIAFTRAINELDLAGALFGEARGEQGAGWNTSITAYEVFEELQALGNKGSLLTKPELRQVLCLYTHLSEAGGVYEGLLNLMGVVQLKPYNMWPFQDLVRVKKAPSRIIGPNANAMFRKLAETATAIGMSRLAKLFELTFRDDIRNGISHSDYILWDDGLRLRRRNGGYIVRVDHAELTAALQIALFFFGIWDHLQRYTRETFRPAREIIGRFSANPPMPWTVECKEDGLFSVSSNAPCAVVDARYERQERINNKLGGRVFAAYAIEENDGITRLLNEIQAVGFDVSLIVFDDAQQFNGLMEEIKQQGLWDQRFPVGPAEGILLATPFGFQHVVDIAAFQAILPIVEELEIA